MQVSVGLDSFFDPICPSLFSQCYTLSLARFCFLIIYNGFLCFSLTLIGRRRAKFIFKFLSTPFALLP
ncbi:hypothetical protein BJ508DRAFT_142873 [Ascobolus immersus RN42]|uniref:Uncharacterized protein n=1 Tax=Ascobolus immersus RN42 TaxID=1160509 RepID=A0A3N4IBZ1_ASCIM|nr:hypothetical protein BJ508DRAFT_142873 [Ascobolus immersus RN42]